MLRNFKALRNCEKCSLKVALLYFSREAVKLKKFFKSLYGNAGCQLGNALACIVSSCALLITQRGIAQAIEQSGRA